MKLDDIVHLAISDMLINFPASKNYSFNHYNVCFEGFTYHLGSKNSIQ